MPDETTFPGQGGAGTATETESERRTRQIPPHNVILLNDDHHSFEFVMSVLRKVLGVSQERAFQFTEEAHTSGRAIIWTGTKEVAELKVEQIRTFHETRVHDGAKLGPLDCMIEPA
ncbi:MAG: ATP-dependent Clp protease adaptor ClpS [Gemmataceae bacterium]